MSPILVRPVREQLEHDRIVRLLQTKSRRRYEVSINPGAEQNVPVRAGTAPLFPDVLLFTQDRRRRLEAIVEVETGESVNHLEALAQWVPFGKARVGFFLYVPATMVDVARRLCEDNSIHVNEIWSYHAVGDQIRFTLMHRSRQMAPAPRPASRPVQPASRPVQRASRPIQRNAAAAGSPRRKPASRGTASARAGKANGKTRAQKRR